VQLSVAMTHTQFDPAPPVMLVTVKLMSGSVTVTLPVVAAAPAALDTTIEYFAPTSLGLNAS
jgi:hypothetical protein